MRTRRRYPLGAALLLGALPLAVSSCGGDDGPTEPDPGPGPSTGSIEVTTATSGTEPDPDGYTVTVDGEDPGVPPAGNRTAPRAGAVPRRHLRSQEEKHAAVHGHPQ